MAKYSHLKRRRGSVCIHGRRNTRERVDKDWSGGVTRRPGKEATEKGSQRGYEGYDHIHSYIHAFVVRFLELFFYETITYEEQGSKGFVNLTLGLVETLPDRDLHTFIA